MGSKLGFHIQKPIYPDWLEQHVAHSGAEWVKMIDPDAGESEPFGSNVQYIGRLWFGDSDKELIWQGADGAEEWWRWAKPRIENCSWCRNWEGPNEPYIGTEQQAWDFVHFERRRVELLHQAGVRAVSGLFGTGNPFLSLWPILGQALEETDYLGLHEYGMRNMALDGWHLLRYRQAIRELGEKDLRVPPILITETGIDFSGDPDRDGWRARGISEDEYLAQLAGYDLELQKDPQVLAATPFTWMHDGWPSFSITQSLSQRLADYMRSLNITLEQQLGDAMQAVLIPQNPVAAFYQYGRDRGWEPISPEHDVTVDGMTYRAQVWYSPEDGVQHIEYTEVGNWANVRHFDREN